MKIKLTGIRKMYSPKNSDEVKCETHGTITTWGELDAIQQLALTEGLDTLPELPCLLAKK